MSRSELHNWECAIEKLSSGNADKMLTIAQDIYNTAYIHGKNNSKWILEDIRDEIGKSKTKCEMQLAQNDTKGKLLISFIYGDIIDIIDKYRAESEDKE